MPLNKITGEKLDGLGKFTIAPDGKWRNTPFFDMACADAMNQFIKAGAIIVDYRVPDEDVLVQEYPDDSKLVFIFIRGIAQKEYYATVIMNLSEDMKRELAQFGMWGRPQ